MLRTGLTHPRRVIVLLVLQLCTSTAFGCLDANATACSDTASSPTIVRASLKQNAVLKCPSFNNDSVLVEWWHVREGEKIGYYDVKRGSVVTRWPREGAYQMLSNGELMIRNARRELVGRYKCVTVGPETNSTDIVLFRLDFSSWYAMPIFSSVFWGSVVSSAIFCAGTFVINIIWIIVRKATLWWLNRAERMQRVRSMVEAMEKYRQRQLTSIHDTYHRRINAIRDNYHQQVDQIRVSYSNQADRFRSYRQAQAHNVAQQLDTLRDNYNQQVNRIREYGSRRAEQLVESYERQLNRMRTFTLQQRLKLMRQYKVKQRYINKLLETIAETDNPETISKQEAAIRAALDLPDLPPANSPLSHSSSYHSLPDLSRQQYSASAAAMLSTPQRSFDTHRMSGSRLSQMTGPSSSRTGGSTEMTSLSIASSRADENGIRDASAADPLLDPRR